MGYPMTFHRFVNRNGLSEGDYGEAPYLYRPNVNMDEGADAEPVVSKVRRERLAELESRMKMLVGDLRRLENDAADEQAICSYIASRTDLHADVVAVVLKEFIAW